MENGGIVGRGVLLDYISWAESQGRQPSTLQTTQIPLSDLKKVAAAQNLSFHPGDILFVRSGYMKSFQALSADQVESYASQPIHPAIGVQAGEEILRWVWENRFSAVAGDMPAFEALPFQSREHWMHEWLLAGWGVPIGELFDLEKLAVECKRLKKWSFFFSSVPLKVGFSHIPSTSQSNMFRSPAALLVHRMELQSCDQRRAVGGACTVAVMCKETR